MIKGFLLTLLVGLIVHDQDYEAWNLASSMLTNDQQCTDMFSNFAWFVERRPD